MLVPWGGAYETGREADAVSISALTVLMLVVFQPWTLSSLPNDVNNVYSLEDSLE